VSKISSVIKYGTLRNSCQNYMENRLCHLFAGLISLIDTNQNLNLLITPPIENFLQLWLHIFADVEFLEISYQNYLLANNIEKTEFVCTNIIPAGDLKLKLPFSWIIKQNMEQLVGSMIKDLKKLLDEPSETELYLDMYAQLDSAFHMSRLKEKLDDYIWSNEFINAYLNDFLLLTSAASNQSTLLNENHVRIVVKRIREYSRTVFKVVNLVSVTLSWTILKNEFNLFSKFVHFDHKVNNFDFSIHIKIF